jgi:hypothetical protein
MARRLVLALCLAAADGISRMGDYNELLTVRELLDLVEFLKGIR